VLLNNNCEVFNKYILEARELPILSMLERIKNQIMTRHYNKQKEAENFVGTVCPKIRKKIAKNAEFTNICYAMPTGQRIFQVQSKENTYIVDIVNKQCECRRWDLTGIPCFHAISCCRHERIPPETVIPACYSVEAFATAYANNIWPCKDMANWEKTVGPPVAPPVYEKRIGRPPKARKKQAYEVQGRNGPKLTKHGSKMHCSWCKSPDHNVRACELKKAGISPSGIEEIPPIVTDDHGVCTMLCSVTLDTHPFNC